MNEIADRKFNDFINKYAEKILPFSDLLDFNSDSNFDANCYYLYEKCLQKTTKLCQELNLKDPFLIASFYTYLLWNGYLSANKDFKFKSDTSGNSGAYVFAGTGRCFNIAALLADIYRKLNIPSHVIGCALPAGKLNLTYRPDVTRDGEDDPFNLKSLLTDIIIGKNIGNHAITVFKTPEGYFMSDPTNLAFLNFNNYLSAQYVGGPKEIPLKCLTLIIQGISNYDFKNLYNELYKQEGNAQKSIDEIKRYYAIALELFRENIPLIMDFNLELQDNAQKLSRTLN